LLLPTASTNNPELFVKVKRRRIKIKERFYIQTTIEKLERTLSVKKIAVDFLWLFMAGCNFRIEKNSLLFSFVSGFVLEKKKAPNMFQGFFWV
jgi:hypothetical protein